MHISGRFEHETGPLVCHKADFDVGRRAFKCFGAILGRIAVAAFEDQLVFIALLELEEFLAGHIARAVGMCQVDRQFCNIDQVLSCLESFVTWVVEVIVHIFRI